MPVLKDEAQITEQGIIEEMQSKPTGDGAGNATLVKTVPITRKPRHQHISSISSLIAWAFLIFSAMVAIGLWGNAEHRRDYAVEALVHGDMSLGALVFLITVNAFALSAFFIGLIQYIRKQSGLAIILAAVIILVAITSALFRPSSTNYVGSSIWEQGPQPCRIRLRVVTYSTKRACDPGRIATGLGAIRRKG